MNKHQSAGRIWFLLFVLFGVPGFSISVGLAAYHFHWREALLSKYAGQQIATGVDVLCVILIALLAAAMMRHTVRHGKYRRR